MLTLLPKGVEKKSKNFLDRNFFSLSTGVNETGGKPCAENISANFRKKLNSPNGIVRGLGETDS
jgi:hypothetical protein